MDNTKYSTHAKSKDHQLSLSLLQLGSRSNEVMLSNGLGRLTNSLTCCLVVMARSSVKKKYTTYQKLHVSSLKAFGALKMHREAALQVHALYILLLNVSSKIHLCGCCTAYRGNYSFTVLEKRAVPRRPPRSIEVCIFMSCTTLDHSQRLSYKQNCKMLFSWKPNQ